MYGMAFDGIKSRLLGLSPHGNGPILHTVELLPRLRNGQVMWMRAAKQDHLVCFLGGTMMMAAAANATGILRPPRTRYGSSKALIEDWRVGHEITRGCVDTYLSSRTGLSPEIAFFRAKSEKKQDRAWTVKR